MRQSTRALVLALQVLVAVSCAPPPAPRPLGLAERIVDHESETLLELEPLCEDQGTGGQIEVSDRRLEPVLDRAWRCDLGGDIRTAVPVLPGRPLLRDVSLCQDSVLRFAFGLKSGSRSFRGALTFRIRVTSERGDTKRFDQQVPAAELQRGWIDGELVLDRFGAGPAQVVFEVDSEHPFDPAVGLPVWGDLRILSPREPEDQRPNIVLISIDTLRADHLSLYGYERATTPAIDAWARTSAVVFEQAVTQASWTLPAHASLFTGVEALGHGANYGRALSPGLELLAERLGGAGYATYATTGGLILHPKYGLSQGFDHYRYAAEVAAKDELEQSVDRACEWMRQGLPEPFLLFLHTYEVHTPFHPRQPFFSDFGGDIAASRALHVRAEPLPTEPRRGLVLEKQYVMYHNAEAKGVIDDPAVLARFYDAGIAYCDQQVGRLLDTLRGLGLESNTVVVLTSDHGESLLEHGLAEHGYLYDDNLMVPLVVALPAGAWKGRRIAQQVRLVDVTPTLLELAGLPAPVGIDGASMLPLVAGTDEVQSRPAWSYGGSANYGISLRLDNGMKYIFKNAVWDPIRGDEELYRIDRAPEEMANLASVSPHEVEVLRRQVLERLRRRTTGVRIRLSNQSGMTLRGELRGPLIKMFGITSPDLDHEGMFWHHGGLVETVVPSGKSFTVMIEDVGDEGTLIVTGGLPGGGADRSARSFNLKVDTQQLDGVAGMRLEDGRWRRLAAADPAPETGVAIWWGPRVGHGGTVADEDKQLRAQLRALGYLE